MNEPKPTYKIDRKAPRMGKSQFSKQIIGKELWEEFRKAYPEHKDLTDKDLGELWGDIAKTVREETVTNPLGVKLGSYTGELKLQYLPHNFRAMNYDDKVIQEVGKPIPHVNLNTRKKVAKIKWERRWAVKFNRMLQFFGFEPLREINKLAKNYIDSNPEKLRVARNTLGGMSVWRQLKNKK